MAPWITLFVVLLPLGLIAVAIVYNLRRADPMRRELPPTRAPSHGEDIAAREFVDAIAHDLRSPLSAILGYQELLGDGLYGPLDPAAAEPVRRIGTSAQRVEQMLAGLTEFVRHRGLAPDLHLATIETGRTILDCVQRVAELAAERGIALLPHGTESLPPLRSDPARLCAALDLALDSCIRSSPSTPLTLAATAELAALRLDIQGTGFAPSAFIPVTIADFAARATDPSRDPSLPLGILRAMLLRIGGTIELLPADRDGARTLRLRIPETR